MVTSKTITDRLVPKKFDMLKSQAGPLDPVFRSYCRRISVMFATFAANSTRCRRPPIVAVADTVPARMGEPADLA